MADVYVATDGSDGNDGTSISQAYATLQTANDDAGLSAGDTVWLVVKTNALGAQQKFTSDTGTITLDTSGTLAGGLAKWRATNATGIVDGTMAIVDFSGETLTDGGIHITGSNMYFQNIGVENTAAGSTGEGWFEDNANNAEAEAGTQIFWHGCSAVNCGDDGFDSNSRWNVWYQCYAGYNINTGDHGFRAPTQEGKHFIGCVAEYNGGDGFSLSHDSSCYNCISNHNGQMGYRDPTRLINCTAAYNTDSGIFAGADFSQLVYMNSISVGNGNYGFMIDPLTTRSHKWIANNAFGLNTSGTYDVAIDPNWEVEIGTITLTEDPFMNINIRDFSLNSKAGGGFLCKNAGLSAPSHIITSTKSFIDLGAVQSAPRSIVVG